MVCNSGFCRQDKPRRSDDYPTAGTALFLEAYILIAACIYVVTSLIK